MADLNLEEKLASATTKMNEITRLTTRRNIINNLIFSYSNNDPTKDTFMMNPLSSLNVALTNEVIADLCNQIVIQLQISLTETETELNTALSA